MAGRNVVAMTRRSGCLHWPYATPAGRTPLIGTHAVRSSAVYYLDESEAGAGLVLVGDYYGTFSLWRMLMRAPITQVANATPGIHALDLRTGERAWEAHPQHAYRGVHYDSIYSAAVSVTSDVLFSGSLDGVVKAFRTSDGHELWSYDTTSSFTDSRGQRGKGGIIDPTFSSIPVTVTTRSAASTSFRPGPGNVLLIFRLPGR